MKYNLKMELDVYDSPTIVEAEKDFDNVMEVTKVILLFIQKFGLADAGEQSITIKIRSIP